MPGSLPALQQYHGHPQALQQLIAHQLQLRVVRDGDRSLKQGEVEFRMGAWQLMWRRPARYASRGRIPAVASRATNGFLTGYLAGNRIQMNRRTVAISGIVLLFRNMADLGSSGTLVRMALAEDLGKRGDITSRATLAAGAQAQAQIVAKAAGVVAGLKVVADVFRKLDEDARLRLLSNDGDRVDSGDCLCELEGRTVALLGAERSALNFLQHLSGIATLTQRYVDAVAGSGAVILDTRKTTPGWRGLEKYAVRMGGGCNHRAGLYDALLIKENHIAAAGGITAAMLRIRACSAARGLPVIIEVERQAQLEEALGLAPQRILLDNMSLTELREAVVRAAGRVPLEASGNMTLERVPAVAETGVDFISVGALTHSAPALDCTMKIVAGGDSSWTR